MSGLAQMKGRSRERSRRSISGIVLRRLDLVLDEPGADDRVRLELLDQFDVDPVIEREIAIRSEVEDSPRRLADQVARHVARGHHPVPGGLAARRARASCRSTS